MKRLLILIALLSVPVFSAENWDRTQLNLKLQKGDWSIKYREYVTGVDSDGEVINFTGRYLVSLIIGELIINIGKKMVKLNLDLDFK